MISPEIALEWLAMDQMDESAYRKRFFAIVCGGACALLVLVLAFVKGALSPRELSFAALILWIVMFVSLFLLIRARRRSAEVLRTKQIASGVPVDTLERDRCATNIRSMKQLIGVFALLLVFAVLETNGYATLPRAVGIACDLFFMIACTLSLIRSRKRLKELTAGSATAPERVD
ncbi:MAG TPA: hypothetical protein VFW25_12175 [Silvibacterium sp.]|nr:hypothetical protein [Silvibacterium sp.]